MTLIGAPREVKEAEEEGGEEKLIGWEADMDYMSCADPATWETAKGYFDALAARMPYQEASEEAERAAYDRALPPPKPEPVEIYSKLKIYQTAATMGFWDPLEAWMKATTVENINVYEAWLSAQVIANDYPRFDEILVAVAQVTGKTVAELKEILKTCLADEAEIAAAAAAASNE